MKRHFKGFFVLLTLLLVPSCINSKIDRFDIDRALDKPNLFDILILGSGPAGLAAGLYAARSKMKTGIVTGVVEGGQLMLTTEVENILGQPVVMGPEFMTNAVEQVQHLGVDFIYDVVVNIDTSVWPYKVTTEGGQVCHAMTVVIATGVQQKKLNIPGEEEFAGYGVSYCAVCDAFVYENKDVAVVGGGDSAVHEAIQLSNYAKNVYILIRKSIMRAMPIEQERLEGYDNIFKRWNTEVKEVIGAEVDGKKKVTALQVYDNKAKQTYNMPVDGLFVSVGSIPSTGFLQGAVELDPQGYIVTQCNSQRTSVEGIFVAGDVQNQVGHQAMIAMGRGTEAGRAAVKFLVNQIGLDRKAVFKLKKEGQYFKSGPKKAEGLNTAEPTSSQEHKIVKIQTLAQLEEQIEANKDSGKAIFVYVGGEHCPACKLFFPVFTEVSKAYADRGIFLEVDAGESRDISEKFVINRIPTLLVFRAGAQAARFTGMMPKKELAEFFDSVLGK